MRTIFGLLSLVLALLVIGFLARNQLRAINQIKVPTANESVAPATVTVPALASPASPSNAQQQSQQIQQQFKAVAEAAVQQGRVMPDDKP